MVPWGFSPCTQKLVRPMPMVTSNVMDGGILVANAGYLRIGTQTLPHAARRLPTLQSTPPLSGHSEGHNRCLQEKGS